MTRLVKKIKISYVLNVLTGLHIGGSKDSVEIGGIDNPVITVATRKGQPYIPGSSLKGKMRCLMEQINGAVQIGDCEKVNAIFGYAKTNQPSKLIVRDAYLTDQSAKQLAQCESLDMPYTENKFENTIDRVQGKAANPRQQERVPAGAKFAVEFVLNVWDDDDESNMIAMLKQGIDLIENDYLGGSGSRGYGQVKFENEKKEIVYPK